MPIRYEELHISAAGPGARRAAAVLEEALRERMHAPLRAERSDGGFEIRLAGGAGFESDDTFEIAETPASLTFSANGVRGLIYAVGLFLRKAKFTAAQIELTAPLAGVYSPAKPIRGHQLGYRPINNTYDKWDVADFRKYMTELMFFGMNTVEFIPFTERNALMKYDGVTMTALLSEEAHALGLDVSLWIPNGSKPAEEELREREALFQKVPYIDAVFVPGSDPGDLPAEALIDRCNDIYDILIEYHPKAKIWPSAQAPHNAPGWGEAFIKALERDRGGIAGVITGPNRAFNTDVLRARLPEKYPIRFYPDITHNLRCEHPVHFEKDDWHYAFAACLSRESINPRPAEYARLFKTVAPYTVGSVTYSDGVNDDVNKAVWCALEWDPKLTAEEIIEDYARAYLYDYDTDKLAAGIFMLELNWADTPLNKRIDATYHFLESEARPENDWRFWQLLFRAACDLYVKERFLADTAAVGFAKAMLLAGNCSAAKEALMSPLPEHVIALRAEIDACAGMLYKTVGMQLSVERYGASGWERGATLDTVDLPVTDREWLLSVVKTADEKTAKRAAQRNDVAADEYYFSVALNGLDALGVPQTPDFYMNIQGDRPNVNDGTLPVCLQKVFDHYDFHAEITGLSAAEYTLRVTYFKPDERFLKNHTVIVNGKTPDAPVLDEEFTRTLLPKNFCAYSYVIPAESLKNGKAAITIAEPERGFQLAEFFLLHGKETQ